MADLSESTKSGSELVLPIFMVMVIVVMVLPVPRFILDMLLTMSITLSLLVLLVALYSTQPLDFSSFPTMLLIATLFRLGINVATTRVILLHGNEGPDAAGQVIQAFGNFVVGGNYVVGIIVFIVLVVINFVVITKGSTRIAEVSARFTLDAMPGKQMAIDADLNAGLIDDEGARTRRKKIEQEADFYGSMDGAAKFVRGDAVAGIVITLVNILGGFIIGVAQMRMDIGTAAANYTILSVGDGLVSQIPALIISTAAGIVVTRASNDSSVGGELTKQLFGHSKVMLIASGILGLFAVVPGLPMLPFMILALIIGFVGFQIRNLEQQELMEAEEDEAAPAPDETETIESLLSQDLVELEVGYGLIGLVDMEQGGDLLEKVRAIRRQWAQNVGVVIPPIHIRDNLQLKPGQYRILIKGVEVGTGDLMYDRFLAMDPGTVDKRIDGIPTKEPTFGLPALWIRKSDSEAAQFAGYTVVDIATVITTHLNEIFRVYAHELITRQDVQQLLDNLAKKYPKVVEELVPNLLPLGAVQKVIANLLREEICVKDLLTIVETLADYSHLSKDPDLLTEYVRQSLSRPITEKFLKEDGTIPVVTVDPKLERILADSLNQTQQGSYLAIDPDTARKLIGSVELMIEKFERINSPMTILCSPVIRGHLRRFLEKFVPDVAALSHNEVDPRAKILSLGTIGI
jgi:flagellar biosynthesis protein FlhA